MVLSYVDSLYQHGKIKLRKYFGTDGIRGRANHWPVTPDVVMRLGMAAGSLLLEKSKDKTRALALIGKDTRRSGYMLQFAMSSGLVAAGVDVLSVGPMPTPAVAMLTKSMRADLGVMITASHNPNSDNGIKLFDAQGFKLSDSFEAEIESRMDGNLEDALIDPDRMGQVDVHDGAIDRYMEAVKRALISDMSLAELRVVIDCANGAGYRAGPTALWELGVDVISHGDEPDGFNINHGCGSMHPQKLADLVRNEQADLGVALDGDGDRVILVDETGKIIDGDQILACIAQNMHKDGLLRGGAVVSTIMANSGFETWLSEQGLQLTRTPVGDRYVVARMLQDGNNLGGEQSGHIVLTDHSTTGDGLVAALQIMTAMVRHQRTASEVCRVFSPRPQILENVKINGADPLANEGIQALIMREEKALQGQGRLLVRKSGTEPVLRVMAECESEQEACKSVARICEAVRQAGLV